MAMIEPRTDPRPTQDYTANQIQILEGLDALRRRPVPGELPRGSPDRNPLAIDNEGRAGDPATGNETQIKRQ